MKHVETARRLAFALGRKNMIAQELADKSGVGKASISQYLNGAHKPSNISSAKIAKVLGVNPLWLMGFDVPMDDTKAGLPDLPSNILTPAAYPLPILGTICAGDGILCEENFDGFFFVDNSIRASYCLHVHGDSMMDAEIYDEDIVFIRKDFEYEDGKIYAVVYGAQQDAVLRKIYRDGSKVILTPCNNSYKPLVMDPDDIFIIGECVGMYRPIK